MAMVGVAGYASRTVSVSSTALSFSDMGFTDDEIKQADSAHVSVFGNSVRYWYNGDVPTASTGHPIPQDGERIIRGQRNIKNIQFISTSGTATLAITLGTFGVVK